MELGLKWVHMGLYELILRQDGAIWLRIVFKTPLTAQRHIKIKKLARENQDGCFLLQTPVCLPDIVLNHCNTAQLN